jgi:hypothetical protein
MSSYEAMEKNVKGSSLVDVVMKCGQIACGQVVDMSGDFIEIVNQDDGSTIWVRYNEVAFFKVYQPFEPVRYDDDVGYESPYEPSPYSSQHVPHVNRDPMRPPMRRPRVAVVPGARSRIDEVKDRHRSAEFGTRRPSRAELDMGYRQKKFKPEISYEEDE